MSVAIFTAAHETIRQPLKEMGCLGAEYLLKRIRENDEEEFPSNVTVEPELVIRQSTVEVKNQKLN